MHRYLDLANFPQCLLHSANCPHLPHADAAQHPECVFGLGHHTLFLLETGLSNTAALTASAFLTLDSVLFAIPTGVVADTSGCRRSHLWGGFSICTPFITLTKKENTPFGVIEDYQTV